ncbi:MAG: MFS transporter [Bacillaceae bacterium]|nr:MFS transporter [Bacillaceae bacterium]
MISIAQFLAMQVWFNFSAVIPVVETLWGLTATQSGLIVAFFHIGYVIAVFFYSFLSDRYNPRHSFIFGAFLAGSSGVLFALIAEGFWSALILRTISGIGIAGIYVPGMKLLAEIFPPAQRGKAIGVYVGSLVVGSGFSLLVSGVLIDSLGWSGVILMTSISCLLASALVYLAPIPHDVNLKPVPFSRALLKKVLRKPNLLVNISYSGHCWELYAMWSWIGPFLVYYFKLHGFDSQDAIRYGNLAGSLVIMLGGIATYMGGRLSDRIGRTRAIQIFIVISIACSLSIGWLTFVPVWLMLLIAVIYGYTIIADSPVYNTFITEIADPSTIGLALGIQSVMGFSVTAVSPVVFGLLLDHFHWGMAFTVLGLVTLVTPISVSLLHNMMEKKDIARGFHANH